MPLPELVGVAMACQAGTRKAQATKSQHRVVRDEGKGWDVRKRESRVALACWAAELSTALLLPHHLTPKILALPKQLLTPLLQ